MLEREGRLQRHAARNIDLTARLDTADRFLYGVNAAGRNHMMAGWVGVAPRTVEEPSIAVPAG